MGTVSLPLPSWTQGQPCLQSPVLSGPWTEAHWLRPGGSPGPAIRVPDLGTVPRKELRTCPLLPQAHRRPRASEPRRGATAGLLHFILVAHTRACRHSLGYRTRRQHNDSKHCSTRVRTPTRVSPDPELPAPEVTHAGPSVRETRGIPRPSTRAGRAACSAWAAPFSCQTWMSLSSPRLLRSVTARTE